MCNVDCIVFTGVNLKPEHVRGKRVLDVGALSVNGSVRPLIESWGPAEYVGIDLDEGPAVDIVLDAEKLVEKFGKDSFDVVVTTELLEHVRNWRTVISNMKNVCKPGGKLLVTTRSYGKPYHAWPYDFWRYEADDMKQIFADFKIERVAPDPLEPGVFVFATKPTDFTENDLSQINLYSIITGRRTDSISDDELNSFVSSRRRRESLRSTLTGICEGLISGISRLLRIRRIIKR